MKSTKLMCAALTFLAAVPTALASNKQYVDGKHGNDNNDCKSRQHACKTIRHAIVLSSRGDSIKVEPAMYKENLNIPFSLKILGSGATTTIIDGRGAASVIGSASPKANVTLSHFTNGAGPVDGGGIYNCFDTLTVVDSIITNNRIRRGGRSDGYGAGIYNCPSSTLTLNTTITGNIARRYKGVAFGGDILNGDYSSRRAHS
jgi:hypothetical protein